MTSDAWIERRSPAEPMPTSSRSINLCWTALVGIPAFCVAIHQGHLLNFGFPVLVFIVALIFAKSSPRDYIRLVILILVFCPFVRRLADYFGGGFTDPSPVLIAQYVVPLAGLRMLSLKKANLKGLLPINLTLVALLNGVLVAFILHVPVNTVALTLLREVTPLLIAFYVVQHSMYARELVEISLQTLRWASLASAVYGLYQYAFPPAWDFLWLKSLAESGAGTSYGRAAAFEFRVFGTLHSGGVAAHVWGVGVVCWLFSKSRYRSIAAAILIGAISVTLVRTEWICLPIAIVTGLVLTRDQWKANMRGITGLVAIILVFFGIAAAANPDVVFRLSDRFSTLGQSSNDESYNSRKTAMAASVDMLKSSPFGYGLGFLDSPAYDRTLMANPSNATPSDLGLLGMFFDLGILGTILYLFGFSMVLRAGLRARGMGTAVSIICTCLLLDLTHVWSNNVFVAPTSFLLWLFGGLVCALDSRRTASDNADPQLAAPLSSNPLGLLPDTVTAPASLGELS